MKENMSDKKIMKVSIAAIIGIVIIIATYMLSGNVATTNNDYYGNAAALDAASMDAVDTVADSGMIILGSETQKAHTGEKIIFTLKVDGVITDYPLVVLNCGDGIQLNMKESDSATNQYTAECLYTSIGNYEVYARIYDSRSASIVPLATSNIIKIIIDEVTAVNAVLTSETDTVMQAEYLSFNLRLEGGVYPESITLYCGDGTSYDMESISTGAYYTIYGAQCRYSKTGKYTAYAILHHDVSISNVKNSRTNNVYIKVTGYINLQDVPDARITASSTEIREGNTVTFTIDRIGGVSPYRNITIYCGSEDVFDDQLSGDVLEVTCYYPTYGTFVVYAIVYDFIHEPISSDSITINVAKKRGGGGSGSGSNNEPCVSEWVCGQWGDCINGIQNRGCTDLSSCTDKSGKPSIERNCSINIISEPEDYNNTSIGEEGGVSQEDEIEDINTFNLWPTIIFILVLILLVLYFAWVTPERKRYTKYITSIKHSVHKARTKGHSDPKIEATLRAQGHKVRHITKAMK